MTSPPRPPRLLQPRGVRIDRLALYGHSLTGDEHLRSRVDLQKSSRGLSKGDYSNSSDAPPSSIRAPALYASGLLEKGGGRGAAFVRLDFRAFLWQKSGRDPSGVLERTTPTALTMANIIR
jgi:hypothetical protein